MCFSMMLEAKRNHLPFFKKTNNFLYPCQPFNRGLYFQAALGYLSLRLSGSLALILSHWNTADFSWISTNYKFLRICRDCCFMQGDYNKAIIERSPMIFHHLEINVEVIVCHNHMILYWAWWIVIMVQVSCGTDLGAWIIDSNYKWNL